jgi:hypothetical protein
MGLPVLNNGKISLINGNFANSLLSTLSDSIKFKDANKIRSFKILKGWVIRMLGSIVIMLLIIWVLGLAAYSFTLTDDSKNME